MRSTVLLASIASIRDAGHFDDYVRLVPAEIRPLLLESVAGAWLPVQVGRAHYAACDRLGISQSQQLVMGRATAERVGESMVGTISRMARQAGATPWLYFSGLQRFWNRAYDGGGLAVYKTGPKDARLELVSFSLCEIPYYRTALRGWVDGLSSLFCTRMYLREGAAPDGPSSMSLRAQWV